MKGKIIFLYLAVFISFMVFIRIIGKENWKVIFSFLGLMGFVFLTVYAYSKRCENN